MKQAFLLFSFLAISGSLLAQQLNITVDPNRFLDEKGNTIFEINYQIPYQDLKFERTEQGFVARLKVNFALNKGEKIAYQDEFVNKIIMKDAATADSPCFFSDKIILALAGSGYLFTATFRDEQTDKSVDYNHELNILPRDTWLSEVEFLFDVVADSTNLLEKFHRQGQLFYLNSSHIYTLPENDKLWLYYIYYPPPDSASLIFEMIKIKRKQEIILESAAEIEISAWAIPIVKHLDISHLEEGYYELVISAGLDSLPPLEIAHDYFSIRMENIFSQRLFIDLEDEFMLLKYFLTGKQAAIWKTLTEQGKINFLNRFWSINDPDPSTEKNEFLLIVKDRIDYCNNNFSYFKEGWKTDRGRIYIKHGEPDEIIKLQTGLTAKYLQKDYQIWKYRTGTELTYIFIDLQTSGNYRLIYVEDDDTESSDPRWQSYLGEDFDLGLLE
ncbi:MAG: GWxTD domain-containing protein [Candidatus Cloacimonetes bacterium]|nr:GWxTD domain-containing protein [Candidatus Cloacimonadota bacterium]